MKPAALLALAALLTLGTDATSAANPRNRSDSGQFTVYCDDARFRSELASFASRTKSDLLTLLGERDNWQCPIVITVEADAKPEARRAPVNLHLVEGDTGMKVAVEVLIGAHPEDVNLQKQITRAVLLEFMYRTKGVAGGESYIEPPWWFVEGAVEIRKRRDTGINSTFFRRLVETNRLPAVEDFLSEKPEELGPTALAMDRALAMSLVQLLVDQPGGRGHLAALLRKWPHGGNDPVAALSGEFPALAGGAPAIQKWWTLNLARFASTDRVEALTAEDTDRKIAALLEFNVAGADGGPKRFTLADFERYRKLPASRAVLATQRNAFKELNLRANALLRPVISEYGEICGVLARGKTRGLRERLARTDELRHAIVHRVGEIADYLNWFEATQMHSISRDFEGYLRAANQLSERDANHDTAIGRYLDSLEKEFTPSAGAGERWSAAPSRAAAAR